jgi:hypothetical protein
MSKESTKFKTNAFLPQQAPSIHAANFCKDACSLLLFFSTYLEYLNKLFEKTLLTLVHNTSISLALTQCGSYIFTVKTNNRNFW